MIVRFGQFLVSTLPVNPSNENELNVDAMTQSQHSSETGGDGEEMLCPRRICLRNIMLELVLCLIHVEGGEVHQR